MRPALSLIVLVAAALGSTGAVAELEARSPAPSKRLEPRAPAPSKRAPVVEARAPQPSKRAPAPAPSKRAPEPQPSKRSMLEQIAIYNEDLSAKFCPAPSSACPIDHMSKMPETLAEWDGVVFECVDFEEDLKACGGCGSVDVSHDCTAIPNALAVSCVQGACQCAVCSGGVTLGYDSSVVGSFLPTYTLYLFMDYIIIWTVSFITSL
ncbi:hypothetical protein NEOLEDRAFT_1168120 [Neolentinus lepideus HHB14362 ss-1]|uniref:Protein CPL1-like domain-containing protein n=1 Tax=Neolentinus lepideus HHB14362 ss-1 TaxID=1314782 RepID=A0A165U5Q5_9AGAM|nr:hypothetical protein NEOLEDRAFT_1168120 [Neolentinus lepideus HHB14362 ss-1]